MCQRKIICTLLLPYKVECGADHLITQLFLDNSYFYDFYEKAQIAGVDVPIEAGIMPVTNKRQIERMVKMCGVELPKKFVRVLEKYEHNEAALRDAGIAYAVDQITDLITEWNCQEMYSRRIPKILDRQISGSVMRELL